MRNRFSLSAGLISFLFLSSYALAAEDFSEMEKQMDAFVEKFQVVPEMGIAVGIVRGQDLVYFKGYGYRDREKKLPVTANTRFAIGSVTKNFVSTSFALLQEQNKLQFQDRVQTILPDFQLELPAVAEQVTFEDIFSHQVGLPRHDLLWYFTPFTANELFPKLRFLETDKRQGMGFRSGKTQYNNLMFMVAGEALEKVSGKQWTNFVKDSLLDPLEMKDTTFSIQGFEGGESALGYSKDEYLPYKSLDSVGPAGSINSTVNDMAKWVAFHLTGSTKSAPLLSRESLENLQKSRSTLGGGQMQMGYGLALMVSKVGDHEVIHHGGNIDGFSAMMAFVPKQNLGIVILTNQNGAGNFQYPLQIKEKEGAPPVSLFPYLILENLLPKSKGSELEVGSIRSSFEKISTKNVVSSLESALNVDFLLDLQSPRFQDQNLSWKGPSWNLELNVPYNVSTPESPESPKPSPAPIFDAVFFETAYGRLELREGKTGEQIFQYYNAILEMKPTDKENIFELHMPSGGGKLGMQVEVVRVGSQVESILVPFEPAVRPLRFVKNTASRARE